MRIPVKFIDMKAPLFIGGKNFGTKIGNSDDHKKAMLNKKLTLWFDDRMQSLLVYFEDGVSVVHVTATLSWTPMIAEDVAEKKKVSTTTVVTKPAGQMEKQNEQ